MTSTGSLKRYTQPTPGNACVICDMFWGDLFQQQRGRREQRNGIKSTSSKGAGAVRGTIIRKQQICVNARRLPLLGFPASGLGVRPTSPTSSSPALYRRRCYLLPSFLPPFTHQVQCRGVLKLEEKVLVPVPAVAE